MILVAHGRAGARERCMRNWGLILGASSFCAAIIGVLAMLAQNSVFIFLAHMLAAITGGYAGSIADRRRLGAHFFPWIMAFMLPLFGGGRRVFSSGKHEKAKNR